MTTPDYRVFLSGQGLSQDWIVAINDAGRMCTYGDALVRETGGDIDKINPAFDKAMDELVARAGGDMKLALFGAVAAYAQAAKLLEVMMKP